LIDGVLISERDNVYWNMYHGPVIWQCTRDG